MKPFVKRQKNDAADAEAICEAAQRPTMRFVPVKSEEVQGAAMVFRVRELLIRQRTQAINALRGHLAEFGLVVPQGAANAARLIALVEDPDSGLPAEAIATLKVLVTALVHLEAEIGKLDVEIERRAKENEVARRLMTVPGIGPLIATALAVLAPPPETFRARARLRGLAGPHAATALDRRQAAARRHDEDGRAVLATAADPRGQQRDHQAACPRRGPAGHLARAPADTQAADAGAGGAGQQDGADRLGADGPRRRLPGSGRGGVSRRGREDVGAEEGKERYGATVVRRDRDTQGATECHRARGFDLDPTREHHTGPRHARRPHQRPDRCQHPTARQNQLRRSLLRKGRLQMLRKSREGFIL